MTAEIYEVVSPTNPLSPAPVRITPVPTTSVDGTPGNKGVQLVVIILDDYGVQRELLNLDATTTNVATLLADGTTGVIGNNTAPTAEKLSMNRMCRSSDPVSVCSALARSPISSSRLEPVKVPVSRPRLSTSAAASRRSFEIGLTIVAAITRLMSAETATDTTKIRKIPRRTV